MKKRLVVIVYSVLAICVLALTGFRGFVKSIRDQRTCNWANIDNVEMHAHIDVPRVTTWDCSYDKERNTKRAAFTIDPKNFDNNRYIQWNNLKPLPANSSIKTDEFLGLTQQALEDGDFYFKENSPGKERFNVLFQQSTGKLWVTISYKD